MTKDQKTGNSINPETRDLLSPYLDGEVTADERARVQDALAQSAELRAELDSLRHTVQIMQTLPRMVAPRPFTLSAADVGLEESKPRGFFGWLKPAITALGAVAALAVVVVVGMTIFRQSGVGGQNATQIALAPQPEMMQEAAAPTEPPRAMTFSASAAETTTEAETPSESVELQMDTAAAPLQKAAVPETAAGAMPTELPAAPTENLPPMAAAAAAPQESAADAAVCAVLPQGGFATIWLEQPDIQSALGCPTDPHPRVKPAAWDVKTAFQPFEGGVMFWSDHVGWYEHPVIYILFTDGTYRRMDDTFNPATDAVSGDETPPDGKVVPQNGFGKVWRTESGVRAALDWATAPEQPGTGKFQQFEHGEMVYFSQTGQTVVFFTETGRAETVAVPFE